MAARGKMKHVKERLDRHSKADASAAAEQLACS